MASAWSPGGEHGCWRGSFRAVVANFSDTRGQFSGRQFFHGLGGGDGFRMIQEHCIYPALCFCYCIGSPSDHQALDPRGWGPLEMESLKDGY